MPRIPNRYGGGARTNYNGLGFEQETSLVEALENAGYEINGIEVYKNGIRIGISAQKHDFYTYFINQFGIDYLNINSKKWLPDEAFINEKIKLYILLKKSFKIALVPLMKNYQGVILRKKNMKNYVGQ